MTYREVTGNAIDIKTPGTEVEGVYSGSRTFETQYGEQVVYNIGQQSIYGFTTLNIAMQAVPVGAKVKVVYVGKEKTKTKRGLVDLHKCHVYVDDDGLDPTANAPRWDPDDDDRVPA